jgi:superfamily II DNA helicase RecQ
MQVKLFTIPITDTGAFAEEMNRFLRGHKVLEMKQELVHNEGGAFWCFCVRYMDQPTATSSDRQKVDYKETLDEATFKVFSRLRDIRREISKEDDVPAYAVFLDEELAKMAQLESLTPAAIRSIKGIGEKKAEKYTDRLIERFSAPVAP